MPAISHSARSKSDENVTAVVSARTASNRARLSASHTSASASSLAASLSHALPDLPHFFAWPLSSPPECDEGVSSGCADGRAYLDQILDLESTGSQESDPVAVR